MKYCVKCVYPDTKPDLTFNEDGVCSACLNFEARSSIDWDKRAREFKELFSTIGVCAEQPYHCVIPVSGGKDSHYQVIKALEHGLRPLAVTAITDDLSELGRENLENITKLGVDHVCVATNARLRRRINKYTLATIGDISWAEHVTIFSIPVREAILRKIPIVMWGENPQNEYGAPNEESAKTSLMRDLWLNEFGGLNGLRVQDLVVNGVAKMADLKQYYFPSVSDFKPKGIFLGQFFPWDGLENAIVAKEHGFKFWEYPVENSGVYYENLDNHQTGIHDRFKYLKFGFGRATDIACNNIRRGRMTREEAIEYVNDWDGNIPITYLGKYLRLILAEIDLTENEYYKIEERFANQDLFDFSDGIASAVFRVGENA